MSKKLIYIKLIAVLCFVLISASCSSTEAKSAVVEINGNILKIEIADNDTLRSTGLMNRKRLAPDSGMLFVYTADKKMSFWMKDTFIPLSIAFISSDGTIKEIRDMAPLSHEDIISKNSVRYALEVNRGYFVEKNIKAGDKVILPKKYRQ